MAASALAERVACAALFWARRRDDEAIRGAVSGLDEATRQEVVLLLEGQVMEGWSDAELQARMLDLSAKSRTQHKIVVGEVKSIAMVGAGPVTGTGSLAGYIASF